MTQPQRQIQIRATDQELKGSYSNLMRVGHTQEEFVLDFFSVSEEIGMLASRIFMNPAHLKRMLGALEDNMKRYEERFGKVTPAEATVSEMGFQV